MTAASDSKLSATRQQVLRATASGWVGSALEYYDFFIYATAAALIFPQLFFPSSDPTVAIVASLGTYGVGYAARPVGAFFLGHWGDTHGRRNLLIFTMLMMGLATACVGFLPTYSQIGIWAPIFLVILRLIQGFALGGELTGASTMVLENAPFGWRGYYGSYTLQGTQAGQVFAAAVFLPLLYILSTEGFNSWGWRIPFMLSLLLVVAGLIVRLRVAETPVFTREQERGDIPTAPIIEAFQTSWKDMLRVVGMAFSNVVPVVITVFGAAYAVQPAYGIGFSRSLYLWIPVVGNIVAVCVIPFAGRLSDKVGRRPMFCLGILGSSFLASCYLYAVSIHSAALAVVISLVGWGVIYQGYNAIFPSFFPELFPSRVRVCGMAIAQNIGIVITAFLPMIFAAIAPPGSANIPLTVGTLGFGFGLISVFSGWSAREPYRIRSEDLGKPDAVPVDKEEYERARTQDPFRTALAT
jgi:MFS family permease